ncbi:hypothetical protein EVAR_67511_1 [Eumeta japonica]|uniref:Uncharacterized protein n=1 Tax=Eumeta variegata TaxID=151549 RepID=A0A4C2A4S2_EUMVA|nr:hypothetical protein EVAR_67511_1 [Eumeta japonica]
MSIPSFWPARVNSIILGQIVPASLILYRTYNFQGRAAAVPCFPLNMRMARSHSDSTACSYHPALSVLMGRQGSRISSAPSGSTATRLIVTKEIVTYNDLLSYYTGRSPRLRSIKIGTIQGH